MAYEKGKPEPGIKAKLLDDRVRGNNDFIQPAINNEHNFVDADANNQSGDHTQGSARCFFAATAPAVRIDTTSFVETDNGSLWVNSGDNALSIMTDYSQVVAADKWTLVSDEVISVLLAANRVFAGTLGVDGDFEVGTGSEFTVAAASGNVTTAGTIDIQSTIPVVGVIDDDTMATATDTNLATSESITAYADASPKAQMKADNVADATFGAGSESCAMANGLIIKIGTFTGTGTSGTITYGDAFPGGVLSVVLTAFDTASVTPNLVYKVKTASNFTWAKAANINGFSWISVGY